MAGSIVYPSQLCHAYLAVPTVLWDVLYKSEINAILTDGQLNKRNGFTVEHDFCPWIATFISYLLTHRKYE